MRAREAKNATPAVPVAAAAPSSTQMDTALATGIAALGVSSTIDQLHKVEVLYCVCGQRPLEALRTLLPFLKRGAAELTLMSERYMLTHNSKEPIGSQRGHCKRVSKSHF